jgi:hypothetical protein
MVCHREPPRATGVVVKLLSTPMSPLGLKCRQAVSGDSDRDRPKIWGDGTIERDPVEAQLREGKVQKVFGPQPQKHSLRRLPGLIGESLKLVWSAGQREFLATASLQILNGLAVVVQPLFVKAVLVDILSGQRPGGQFRQVLIDLAVLGGVFLLTNFSSTIQNELQRVLSELVNRQTAAKVLDVAIAAPLRLRRQSFTIGCSARTSGWGCGPFKSPRVWWGWSAQPPVSSASWSRSSCSSPC